MRIAFLHVGHPKTASSYLQHVMHLNATSLHEAGIYVPSDFVAQGHYDFVALSRREITHSGNASPLFYAADWTDSAAIAALASLLKSDRDLLLSSELLLFHPNRVEWTARLLKELGYYVHVIAYIGSYADMAVKAYCQNIRNAGTFVRLEEFLRAPGDRYFLKYFEIFRRLVEMPAIDRVSFRPFAPHLLKQGNIVDDFFGMVAPALNPAGLQRPVSPANATLPLAVLEALRVANRFDKPTVVQRLREMPPVETAEQRRQILSFYYTADARAALEETYGDDRRSFLRVMPPKYRDFWNSEPEMVSDPDARAEEIWRVLSLARLGN